MTIDVEFVKPVLIGCKYVSSFTLYIYKYTDVGITFSVDRKKYIVPWPNIIFVREV